MSTMTEAEVTRRIRRTLEGLRRTGNTASVYRIMNDAARGRTAKGGIDARDALCLVAKEAGLEEVHRAEGGIIYRWPDGQLVNLWLDAPSDEITEGGLGFDNQVEWYTQREDEADA